VSRRLKLFIGISGVLLVTFIALGFFAWYQITKSFPQTTGSVTLQCVTQQIDLFRDPYGVPRIVAANDRDALVSMGFLHAQDRLWQMDLQRRAASGRLSEVFGKATLPFDRMFRIIGLRRIAVSIEQQLPDDTRADLLAYCDGVNAFRTATRGKLPIEFDLLRYDPDPWTPVDCILVGRLIAWELNLSWWTDITYGALVARLGRDTVSQILPSYPLTIPPQVPAEEWRLYVDNLRDYVTTSQEYLAYLGRPLASTGSNAWAIAPNKSATGAVILANDTHLHLTQPSQWYEVGVIAPGLTAHGMSVPGVPGIVAGTNDSIAWGVTNLMADDADFYLERINEAESTYFYDNAWRKLTIIDEEISVRGDTTEVLHVRLTGHGPIVTDIRTPLNQAHPPFVASMRWVGADIDDQVGAFLKINRAHNWSEFVQGLRSFSLPGQNFVYGDIHGNIGYYCAARLPVRGSKQGLLPVAGWERSNDWTGFVPFDQLPHILNPPAGYIASANNKTVDDSYPFYIGQLWEPPSRIQRLQEALGNAPERISVQDCRQLQTDTRSQLAQDLAPYLLSAVSDSTIGIDYGERVREYLRNWDYRFTTEDIATSIYQEFLIHLIHNIFADEMGEELFHDFTMLVNVPLRVTTRLLKEGSSVWFDDMRTTAVETRDDILRRSACEAIQDLVSRLGDDPRLWRWGSLHTVTLQHPFGLQPPLGKIFNVGPFPYPGASTALMSGEYSLTVPFSVSVAASYRQIFSFAEPEAHLAVLPSGESGQVYQKHYDDQTPLWLFGAYRTVIRKPGKESWDHLRLLPGEAGK